jgi:hypothetical protein
MFSVIIKTYTSTNNDIANAPTASKKQRSISRSTGSSSRIIITTTERAHKTTTKVHSTTPTDMNVIRAGPIEIWEPPASNENNPIANLFSSDSPVPDFIKGDITGYWFLDVFVIMNLVLVCSLLLGSMVSDSKSNK